MSQDLLIRQKMRELANLLLSPTNESTEDRSRHGMRGFTLEDPKPKLLASNNFLVLDGKRNMVFTEVIDFLKKDPEVEHLSEREIEDGFVKFVLSVLDGNNLESQLESKIDTTLNNLRKPLEDWNIIAPLEKLQTEVEIIIGRHFIKKILIDDYEKYFFEGTYFRNNFNAYFLDNTCISVIVSANNKDSALTKAKESIHDIISALRTYFGDHYFFHLSEPHNFAIIHRANRKGSFSRFAIDRPTCKISKEYQNTLPDFVSLVEDYLNSTPTTEIGYKIVTAMRWFGDAVEDLNLESKLTKYIISLETLLMTKRDKNCKGSALTYRVIALESHYSNGISEPDEVLWFYKQRNNIVHSGHSEVPLTDSDLRRLEYAAKNTILYICDVVKKHSISDTNELISWIERKNEKPEWVDAREYFIKSCGAELRRYAERLNNKESNSKIS